MQDIINHPSHYRDDSGIECIDVKEHMSATAGDCFKYLYRAGRKVDTIQDLQKARWYAERCQQNGYPLWHPHALASVKSRLQQVAAKRKGNIRYAMEGMAAEQWNYVIACINAEIQKYTRTSDYK